MVWSAFKCRSRKMDRAMKIHVEKLRRKYHNLISQGVLSRDWRTILSLAGCSSMMARNQPRILSKFKKVGEANRDRLCFRTLPGALGAKTSRSPVATGMRGNPIYRHWNRAPRIPDSRPTIIACQVRGTKFKILYTRPRADLSISINRVRTNHSLITRATPILKAPWISLSTSSAVCRNSSTPIHTLRIHTKTWLCPWVNTHQRFSSRRAKEISV